MKNLLLITLGCIALFANAQKMPVSYDFGEKFSDRYRYSNLLVIDDDGSGGYVLVRSYFQGLVLRPKGYFIEHYNSDLQLVGEYNYKLKGMQFVDGFFKNGKLNLLFFNYDFDRGQYEYWAHSSSVKDFDFESKRLLSVKTKAVKGALGKNYYNRNFSNGFTTTMLFNQDKSGFIISTHHKKGKNNNRTIYLFDDGMNKRGEFDFSNEIEEKNYAFENVAMSKDLNEIYITGKAYFKKKRFRVEERKFQYEMVHISKSGIQTQSFDDPGKYSEALYPILNDGKLICTGFYADRKDNRYNGISYFELNPANLSVQSKKYGPFTAQFMNDKFGKDDEKALKNLVFKGIDVTDKGDILFNAEEYFVTNSLHSTGAGQRVKVERFHHNDIVSVKLDASGNMLWARNINKTEVTQGDGAYASYTSHCKDGNTYFFVCTAAKNPQMIGSERLIFKQGAGKNRNVFMISLDESGKMDYERIIGSEEARLPLMVSKPLKDAEDNELLFYAKRGTKKQLVKVAFE